MNKAIFLDRDGVLNIERGEYTFRVSDFQVVPGVIKTLEQLKSGGYMLIVLTNQSGIARGLYTMNDTNHCHQYFQKLSGNLIDGFYVAPGHPSYSESLSRKPDSLMFERAIAKYNIDPLSSYMVGDKERDLIPARKLGIKTILLGNDRTDYADLSITDLSEMLSFLP
ncbi:MAG: HAD-IIIA family hydrolase [Cyclobacteriaceae bacterium]